ncbi:MAG TPA: hypothetical protein VK056_02690 [Bacillota bacterium]|nr:hypothetical protein [Bacillota bacterium]
MNKNDQNEFIIEQYKQDERTMILVFAQWCINEGFDPLTLYSEAYPNQPKNEELVEAMEKTVPARESQYISHETVLQMLHMFGNDDLAFVVNEAYAKQQQHK